MKLNDLRPNCIQRAEVADGLDATIEVERTGRAAGQYGQHHVGTDAFVLIGGAEAAQHKVDHVGDDGVVGQLVAADGDLVGVDDDDEVTLIAVRRERRLVSSSANTWTSGPRP